MSGSSDITDHVTCTIKPSVNLQIGDTKTDTPRSGVSVVDINLPFGKTVNIEDISFKNYYSAFVSVRVLKRTPGQEAQWSMALRDLPLMENPHTEAGSQDYFSIHRDQMLVKPDNVVSVRLILRQPSSAWLTFNLEDIKIHPHTQPAAVKEASDWLSDLTLVDQQLNMEVTGLPDPQAVSSSIQQMWALTEVMQTNQTTASIGRFDVDGCYDIKLLCLT